MATIDPDPDPIQLDRRSFLKTSGTAAAGAALGPGLGWSGSGRASSGTSGT